MKRLFLAAVIALGIHALLLVTEPPWRGTLPGKGVDKSITIELQVLSRPEPKEDISDSIDTASDLPTEEVPIPDSADENLPEPLPESPPRSEPEPAPEPALIPEPEPVTRQPASPEFEPPQVSGSTVEPEPVPDVEPLTHAEDTAVCDHVREKPVKPAPVSSKKHKREDSPALEPPQPPKSGTPFDAASVEKEQAASPLLGVPDRSAPAIIEAKPNYLENDPPNYPRVARRRGYSGTVVLDVLVSRDGHVKEVAMYSSSGHRILDEAAVSAVAGWRFQPGTKNGLPVSMRVKVPVRFSLK